jgi:hypothetical protein
VLFGRAESAADSQSQQILASDPTISELVNAFVTSYWPMFIYCMIGFVYVLYFAYHYRRRLSKRFESWSVSNFILGSLSGVFFLFVTIIGRHPIRIGKYAALFSVIIVGSLCGRLTFKPGSNVKNKLVSVVVVLLIFSAIVVAVPNFYPEDRQFTPTEEMGTGWLSRFSAPDTRALSRDVGDDTLLYYSPNNSRRLFGSLSDNDPPDNLRNITDQDADYFVSKAYDQHLYEKYVRDQGENLNHYTPTDLRSQVIHNVNVDKIYSNSRYVVWDLD